MFILRVITDSRSDDSKPFSSTIDNYELGSSYTIIKRNSMEFDAMIKRTFPNEDTSDIEAILSYGGENAQFYIQTDTPLLEHTYYIMTESGKTFERL